MRITDEAVEPIGPMRRPRDEGLPQGDEQRISRASLLQAERLAGLGSWTRDLSESCLTWSDGFYRLLGLRPGSVVASYDAYLAYVHPDDRSIETGARERLIANGSYECTIRILGADGLIRHVMNRGELARDPEGHPLRIYGTALDVSAQIKAHEALRQSEERFRDYTEVASDWVWETDREHRFVSIAGGGDRQGDPTRATVLGRTRWEAANADLDAPAWRGHRADLDAHRPFREFRYTQMDTNGAIMHIRVSGKPLFNSAGMFLGYRGVATDETASVVAHQRASRAQSRLVDALDGVGDAMILLDVQGNLEAWNRRFAEEATKIGIDLAVPGLSYAELVRARIDYGLHRGGRADVSRIFSEQVSILSDRQGVIEELNDGTWLRTSARRTEDGGWIIVYSDITKSKRREAEVRKLSAAIEQSASMVAIVRSDGTIEYVNQKWCEVTGYSMAEAVGRTPAMLRSGTTPEATYKELWQALTVGKCWTGEILNRRKNGELYWCREVISPLRDADGGITHFVAVEEDVTERRRTEEELRTSKAAAEAANRAKTQFLANMSHELRTPLNAIIGFSEIIRDAVFGPLENQRYSEYIKDIHSSGQHLLALINGVLDAARIEVAGVKLNESILDLAEVVGAAVRMVSEHAKAGDIELSTDLPADLPQLHGDARLLMQVVLNLLTNAVKFTPRGGTVCIEAGTRDDGSAWFSCADTGVGIGEDQLDRVFEPFFQADTSNTRQHQGAGLGLALCKAFVEAHQGKIWAERKEGGGSTIIVELPSQRILRDAAGAIGR